MQNITFIYATTGGNTAWVCEQLVALFSESKHVKVRLVRIEHATKADFETPEVLVLAAPTYGHGQLEVRAQRFYAKNMDFDLTHKKIGIIGLGNPKYDDDYTVESANILQKWVEHSGGSLLCEPLRIVGMPYGQLEDKICAWGKDFLMKIEHETA